MQLDLKRTFDTVDYLKLLDTLRAKGLPAWVVRWLKSWLEGRTTRLIFDGEASKPYKIRAGVSQGLPLSLILFILFISTLYDELNAIRGVRVIGFADDTNILVFARTTQEYYASIERT